MSRATNPTSASITLILLATLGFAIMDALSKTLSQTYGILQILWLRNVVFLAFALWLARPKGLVAALASARPLLQAVRALVLLVEMATFVAALRYLPLADVHAIAAAAPLVVMALSVPLLGEHVGPRRWAAVGVGFLGVLAIVRPGFQEIGAPILIALAGAGLWALYQVLVRLCARHDPTETTLVWTAAVGLLVTSVGAPLQWTVPDLPGWIMLAAIAALGALSHFAYIKAFAATPASVLQPFGYSLMVWAIVVGYLVFGDIPDRWVLSGGALIVASGTYSWHRERVRAREKTAPAPATV